MPHPEIELGHETLLNPELLEGHLAAALDLGFATLLELDLGAHRPAASEVVAQLDHHMRQVETAVALGVLVFLGNDVTQVIIAEKLRVMTASP